MFKKVTFNLKVLKVENLSNEYIDIVLGFINDRNFHKREDSYYSIIRKLGKINIEDPYSLNEEEKPTDVHPGDYLVKAPNDGKVTVVPADKFNEVFGVNDD